MSYQQKTHASFIAAVSAAVLSLSLAGCFDSGGPPAGDQNLNESGEGVAQDDVLGKYDLFNQCFVMKADGAYVTRSGSDFSASGAQAGEAERFYMRAANLARYLFYTPDDMLLTASGSSVSTVAQADAEDGSDWRFDDTGDGALTAGTLGGYLAVGTNNLLVLADAPARLEFEPATGCAQYPEMPLGVSGKSYTGDVNRPVLGFAEVHTHMSNADQLSDGSTPDGAASGGLLYGHAVDRFGVTHALKNCEVVHGPDGSLDPEALVLDMNPGTTHDTQGWPSFVDWPRRNYLTHQVMYYKWVERAWLAGLRIMVNHGTNIAALCRIGQSYALQPDADCDDMSVAVKQIRYLYDVQDYVDAQSGGPGQGWFRIVTSPQQAREVINDGKLAVVLGVEVAQVLDCGVTFLPDGSELRRCDEAQVEAEIDRLWDLGVRHIYPYHDIDSSLGGAGIFNGDVMNYLNYMDTGRFWETTSCRDYPQEEPSVREPGAEMATAIPGSGDDPLSLLLLEATSGLTPSYPPGKRCNARTVTDLGDFTLRKLMAKKMVIDIDHAAYHSKDIMLDIAEAQEPPYPLASSHDAHGGLTSDQAVRMLRSGGLIYPYKGNGSKHRDFLAKLEFWRDQAGVAQTQILGLGYGADANGFGGHPGPRGGDSEAVVYPFQLFSGPDWGNLFAAIEPLSVELLSIPQSGKFWHIDEVGMAHYGLVADFVEEVRLESGAEGLNALYSSAEAYVQMWERVYQRASMED